MFKALFVSAAPLIALATFATAPTATADVNVDHSYDQIETHRVATVSSVDVLETHRINIVR